MSSPSRKWSRGDSPRYHIFLSYLVWVNRIRGRCSSGFSCLTPVVGALCLWLKYRSARGASHHPAFIDNCPTVRHTFLALSTQWMSSLSMVWRRGVSPRFYLIVLCLVWINRIRRQDEFKILLCNTSVGNLLLRQSLI